MLAKSSAVLVVFHSLGARGAAVRGAIWLIPIAGCDWRGETDMEKKLRLRDDTEVLIRDLREDDLDRSLAFFRALPPEDRIYLRNDVTRREVVQERISAMPAGRIERHLEIGTLDDAGRLIGNQSVVLGLDLGRNVCAIPHRRDVFGDKADDLLLRTRRPAANPIHDNPLAVVHRLQGAEPGPV